MTLKVKNKQENGDILTKSRNVKIVRIIFENIASLHLC